MIHDGLLFGKNKQSSCSSTFELGHDTCLAKTTTKTCKPGFLVPSHFPADILVDLGALNQSWS